MIAALFVETDGCYFNQPGIEPWDIAKDARNYTGPHRVVAHPPCQRWGKYWHGAPNKPHQFRLGEDHGCFAVALTAIRNYGGVLEHPAYSHAWPWFGLSEPPARGWSRADKFGGMTCYVEQGHYGHLSRKGTWLYAVGCGTPELIWGPSAQKIHPVALAKHGYAKARRIGMMAMIGGKDKTKLRNATPPLFRDCLLSLATASAEWPPPLDPPKDEMEAARRERNSRDALAPYTVFTYTDDACVSSALEPSNTSISLQQPFPQSDSPPSITESK